MPGLALRSWTREFGLAPPRICLCPTPGSSSGGLGQDGGFLCPRICSVGDAGQERGEAQYDGAPGAQSTFKLPSWLCSPDSVLADLGRAAPPKEVKQSPPPGDPLLGFLLPLPSHSHWCGRGGVVCCSQAPLQDPHPAAQHCLYQEEPLQTGSQWTPSCFVFCSIVVKIYLRFTFFFFCFFRAPAMAYGGSQARGRIGAAAVSLHHSHSNMGSEPGLGRTPQLTARQDNNSGS